MTLEHGIGDRRIQAFDEPAAGRIDAHAQLAGRGHLGKAATDGKGIADLAAEIIDQHGHVVAGKCLMKHLRRPYRRTGITDERMGHGAAPVRLAEIMRRRARGIGDEALGAHLALRPRRADAGRISHEFGHLQPGAVARVHGQKCHMGQIGAHGEGVEGGNAGRSQFLQEDRLEIDQMNQ